MKRKKAKQNSKRAMKAEKAPQTEQAKPEPQKLSRRASLISAISIENFKGIGDRIRIELKPMTLLFGANSAGKSTIMHALHYAREVFERRNLDADRTISGGEFVDLGGFRNVVHNHDLGRSIVLSFELNLCDVELPVYYTPRGAMAVADYESSELFRQPMTACVEVHIGWNFWKKHPQVTRYSVTIDGAVLAIISAPAGREDVEVQEINYAHPMFLASELFDALAAEAMARTGPIEYSYWGVTNQSDALPRWGQSLTLGMKVDPGTVERASPEMKDAAVQFMDAFTALISRLVVGPGELLRTALCEMRYLGPLRQPPGRNHQLPRYPDAGRWAAGLAAWDLLISDPATRGESNRWLSSHALLATGYSVELREFGELTADERDWLEIMIADRADREGVDLLDDCSGMMGSLVQGRRLVIQNSGPLEGGATRLVVQLEPPDLGVGIAQIIPVVVAAVQDTQALTLIEQPELHLHPAVQVRLAELFMHRVHRGLGLVILETHSEHLILRILRRIRETHERELPEGHPGLNPDQVAVIYIEKHDGEAKATPLRIDETGEFRDRWPKGFFEERAEELF